MRLRFRDESKGHQAEPGFLRLCVLLTWHCTRNRGPEASLPLTSPTVYCSYWNQWQFSGEQEGQNFKRSCCFEVFLLQAKCKECKRPSDVEFSPCDMKIHVYTSEYKICIHTVKCSVIDGLEGWREGKKQIYYWKFAVPDTVAHACNLNIQEAEVGGNSVQSQLGCVVNNIS